MARYEQVPIDKTAMDVAGYAEQVVRKFCCSGKGTF
jgi:hypothetical protein